MRLTIFGILAIAILSLTSCQKEDTKNADDLLIEAIKNASNKQYINPDELPTDTRIILETDYFDNYVDEAKKAPELGYEVDMMCDMGANNGKYSQAYFDLNGRELKAYKVGKGDKGDKGDKKSFEFVYPITYVMPDGSAVTGNDEQEVNSGLKAWYEAHPDSKQKPSLQYPVEITFGDKVITVNNDQEMLRVYKACKGDKKRCFDLLYPVTYVLPDETEVIVTSQKDEEAWATIKAWYEAHPDATARPAIEYPVDIKWYNGEIKTINNKDEMMRAKKSCDGHKEKCFELDYPVTYTMPDGSEIIVPMNDDVGWADVKAWYRAHPDSKKRPAIKFPVDLIYKDGSSITVNDNDQMKRAYEACD